MNAVKPKAITRTPKDPEYERTTCLECFPEYEGRTNPTRYGTGILFAHKDGYSYVLRCGKCFNWNHRPARHDNTKTARRTIKELKLAGFSVLTINHKGHEVWINP